MTPDLDLQQFLTPERLERLKQVAGKRQLDVSIVCESLHDPHNISAILRSSDGFGIQTIDVIGKAEGFRGHSKTSASARDWVDVRPWEVTAECFAQLHEEGKTIYVSALDPSAVSLYELDLTKPCALVLGNEHAGASEEVLKLADQAVYIPMAGMVQSFNVSVAAAIMLAELYRQRDEAGMYELWSSHKQEELFDRWLERELSDILRHNT